MTIPRDSISDLTTLQLAEAIVFAVLTDVADSGGYIGWMWGDVDKHAPAIFRVLRDNEAWLCRLRKNGDGVTVSEQLPLWPET